MSAKTIVSSLGGTWHANYGMVRCPIHADRTPSLMIKDGQEGRVVVHCFAGCNWREVRKALALGAGPSPSCKRDANPQPPRSSILAHRIWHESFDIKGSLAEKYLRGRCIDLKPLPATLRFHPRLRHPSGDCWPAMIAAVSEWPSRKLSAIHRTFLAHDGSTKAPVEPQKMMLNTCKGSAVRLGPPDSVLAITEGIEDALSVMSSIPISTWCALSAGSMPFVVLPALPLASVVIVCVDDDECGRNFAKKCAAVWSRQGRSVRFAMPPSGKDFNATLDGAQ